MSEQNVTPIDRFDQIMEPYDDYSASPTTVILAVAKLAMCTSGIKRTPRYIPEFRENNAEHSFMLALAVTELFPMLFPDLDVGLAVRLALVHEFSELMTGDVATFNISDDNLAVKRARESKVVAYVSSYLPPHIAKLYKHYEMQADIIAMIVRFIDKLLPFAVDIIGQGSQIMHEDYYTHTLEDLREAHRVLEVRYLTMFPGSIFLPLHETREILAKTFEGEYQPSNQVMLW
jgi:5'-deoxynucleotidase YfbR-like HD superfamily hydrolase